MFLLKPITICVPNSSSRRCTYVYGRRRRGLSPFPICRVFPGRRSSAPKAKPFVCLGVRVQKAH